MTYEPVDHSCLDHDGTVREECRNQSGFRHWIVFSVILTGDRPEGLGYPYAIEGWNAFSGERISWHVPSLADHQYDLSRITP